LAFVHLHNHTEYSLLDGAARVKDLLKKTKELGMTSLAITDHGVMYGTVHFYKKAVELGINPIIGCEVYVAPKSRFEKSGREEAGTYHLVLLCENETGYKNLCRLVSLAFLEGFYYKPRVDHELLRQYHEGLICLSACIAGEIPQAIMDGDMEKAKKLALEYDDIFGHGNFFLEIQDHGMEEEALCNKAIIELAKELDIGLVATNDLHYVNKEDAEYHDVLLAIQTGKLIAEENRMRFPSPEFYLKTEEEMRELFAYAPEAIENTNKIAERCHVEIELGKHHFMPEYQVPEGFTISSYLRHLCEKGMLKKYKEITPELQERLDYELDIIERTGFPGYFLIVWDMINYCRENDIPVGPGRGSAAGSIVAYALGITNIDPIRYQLLFERFLNPERVTPPDIDTDFCYEKRGRVIEYLVEKYGAANVCQIITFGTMKAKMVVKDVARAMDIPYAEADRVAKLIPDDLSTTLESALRDSAELKALYDTDPTIHRLMEISKHLEGIPRHHGKHAAGVVIAPDKVQEFMPVQKTGEVVVTQFEKEEVEQCGLLKLDALGLRTLTVIDDTLKNIKRSRGIDIDIDNLPLDDKKTFEMLQEGETIAVFQLESEGMRNLMKRLCPDCIEDIIALVAMYRPGPLEGGMVDDYINRKHGREEPDYMHPRLENVLKETYGVILYQEQVMQCTSALAGFSLGQADLLRRAMGKKKLEIILKERAHFVEGSVANGVDGDQAGHIFDLIEKFAGYGFNKSHSAAYAIVTYQTAYLKANYPAEFLAATLTSVVNNPDKVPVFLDECGKLDIPILPPDINESERQFSVYDGAIRFGLAAVKNVGRDIVDELIAEREQNGSYSSLTDLCTRMQVNRKMLESLIKCGALDCFGIKRSQMLAVVDKALELAKKVNADKNSAQMSLFDFGMSDDIMNAQSLEFPDIKEFSEAELLAMEKEMIGFYVSGHPLDCYEKIYTRKISHSITDALQLEDKTAVILAGAVNDYRSLLTRGGESMAAFTLEDKEGSIRCVAFPKTYAKVHSHLYNGNIIQLSGKISLRDTTPQLVIEDANIVGTLYLRLPDSEDAAFIDRVKAMLAPNVGSIKISFYYNDLKQYHQPDGLGGVYPDKILLRELRELLGEANVVLK